MIPLPRVAKILECAADFVENQLITEGLKAQWSVMDNFADILTSVEYYIERYSNSPQEADENLLQRAEIALSNLPGQTHSQDENDEDVDVQISDDVALVEALEQIDLSDEASLNAEVDLASILDAVVEPDVDVDEIDISLPEQELAEEEILVDEVIELDLKNVIEDEPVADVEVVTEVAEVIEEITPVEVLVEEDDLIDDEIIEIFLEEAEEVLETLQEHWPSYRADRSASEEQSTVRRAFHTLKGSGRMVKAEVIGELAWSVENMLNRVIEQTITLDDNACALIDQVIVHIPELIENFRARSAVNIDTASLMTYAEALSQGESVADFATQFSDSEQEIELELEDLAIEEPLVEALVAEDDAAEILAIEKPDDDLEEGLFDDTLLDIFRSEVTTHLEAVSDFIEESQATDFNNELSDQLQRALHTLKGSAHMAGIIPIALVASPLEKTSQRITCLSDKKHTWFGWLAARSE